LFEYCTATGPHRSYGLHSGFAECECVERHSRVTVMIAK